MILPVNKREVWKPIPGYESFYHISNLGKVKSLHFGKERILSPKKNQFGYLNINLNKRGSKGMHAKVHRLVGFAFIPNPNNYPEINHKDGNKENNYYKNLEWITRAGNIHHAMRTGLLHSRPDKHKNARKVIDMKTGKIFGTVKRAAKAWGVSWSCMSHYLNGRVINQSTFKYLDDVVTTKRLLMQQSFRFPE